MPFTWNNLISPFRLDKNVMAPAVESGHPCSRAYIMDKQGGRKGLLRISVLLQEKHGQNVYFLTDAHVFFKS